MTYTVKFDLYIDEEDISDDSDIKDFITECMDSSAISVSNIQVLDVND
jgi:hypothetical protein